MAVNKVPDTLTISLRDLVILYSNLYLAKKRGIGYLDADRSEFALNSRLSSIKHVIPTHELEGLLWAVVMLDESETGEYFHPDSVPLNTFIYKVITNTQFRFYFDKVYNYFTSKRPTHTNGVSSIKEEQEGT